MILNGIVVGRGTYDMMFEVDSAEREDAVVASLFVPWTVTTIGSLLRLYMELDCFTVVILYALYQVCKLVHCLFKRYSD